MLFQINYFLITIISVLGVCFSIAILKLYRKNLINKLIKNQLFEVEEQNLLLNSSVKALQEDNLILRNRIETFIEENASYNSKIEYLNDYSLKLEKDLNILNEKYELSNAAKYEAETQAEISRERLLEMQKRMEDWDKARHESLQHAKAAIFEVGSSLSSKLIEEHRRETEEARLKSHESIRETSEKLNSQFENIVKSMASLHSQVKESKDTVDIVKRALLSPGGAGSLAEITLENILKASGLTIGQDFIMQYSVNVNDSSLKLRPDAIIFLPDGNVMIIDSKASKFFLELASASSDIQEKYIYEKLRNTMRTHLRSLSSKDYLEAVRNHLKSIKNDFRIKNISTIMFLPSETALEKLHYADKDFIQKAWEINIFPAGPVGIINILNHAKFQITEDKQFENSQLIIDEVRKLLSSITVLSDHAKKMGNAIQSVANNYDKFAASFNSNLLSKSYNLQKMGIDLQLNKSLPQALDRYQIVATNIAYIEAELASNSDNQSLEEAELVQIEN
ncbi:MAG: DNA recombination protein RmuC [Alphaproteobacteria bacterium]